MTDLSMWDGVKVLVVDDRRTFGFKDATHVRTSADAIAALARERWEEVWLDHDLGGDDTTMPVVEYLESVLDGRGTLIAIHTQNPVAKERMFAALNRHYYTVKVDPQDYLA